ncbi:MAG TPA: hypothetical protein VIT92_17035 [Burkholderiaceae bacterium]
MKKFLVLLTAAAICATGHTQSLNSLLRGAANDVVRNVAAPKATAAASATPAASGGSMEGNATQAAAPAATGQQFDPSCGKWAKTKPFPAVGERPASFQPASLWPDDTVCPYKYLSELKFTKAAEQNTAFRQASRVPCNDCEGGYSFDAWAAHFMFKSGDYEKQLNAKLVTMKLGETLEWKGRKFTGAIEATGEHPIAGNACKQYHWTLKEGKKVVAEKEGMLCNVKGQYMAEARWVTFA